jgi:hypothetical protein
VTALVEIYAGLSSDVPNEYKGTAVILFLDTGTDSLRGALWNLNACPLRMIFPTHSALNVLCRRNSVLNLRISHALFATNNLFKKVIND